MKIINCFCVSIIAVVFFSGCYEKSSVTKAETNPTVPIASTKTAREIEIPAPTPEKTKTASQTANTPQTKNLKDLKTWVGKYPINKDDKKYLNFFLLPQVKNILTKLLPKKGFQNLLNHFYGVDLIEEKEGFLVMLGTTKRKSSGNVDYALVALKPDTGETHVVFVDNGKMTGYGNTDGESDLPLSIEEKISGFVD